MGSAIINGIPEYGRIETVKGKKRFINEMGEVRKEWVNFKRHKRVSPKELELVRAGIY